MLIKLEKKKSTNRGLNIILAATGLISFVDISELSAIKPFKYIVLFFLLLGGTSSYSQNELIWKEAENLANLNTKEDDFALSFNKFENLLYFNSTVSGSSLFYTTGLLFDAATVAAGSELNKGNGNRSYICFDTESRAFLTAFRKYSSRSYQNIFETRKDRSGWTTPFPIDSLKSESFTAQPTISPDGSIMVFSSNRQSGRLDADLWIAYRMDNGSWGNARPLSALNSNGNELTPFLASEDTLYFASDGQGGPGGLDIFVSVNVMGVWQNPFPVNSVNTRFDESDFIILPDGRAVFSSDRPGGKGKLDLFVATREDSKLIVKQNQSEMEIDVATQVSTVRTYLDLKYNYYPVATTIFSDFYSVADFSRYIAELEEQLIPLPDSIYLYSPGIIGSRLRENPSTFVKLNLLTVGKSEFEINHIKKTADSIVLFLALNYGIQKNRIEIAESKSNFESPEGYIHPLIEITSDNDEILKPLELGALNIRIEPPVIQASVLARPEKEFRRFNCNLYINENKTGYNHESKDITEPFFINLEDYKFSVIKADSIVLKITAWDRYSNIVAESMNINTVYSESKSLQPKKLKNSISEEFYFIVNGRIDYPDSPAFAALIEKVKESCSNSKTIKILYFEAGNNFVRENAQLLAKVLNDKSGGAISPAVEYSPETDKFAGNSKLKPYIVKLVVGK